MRAPKRRRARRDQRWEPTTPGLVDSIAARVSYIVSPEHKDYLTSAGPGRLRSDATACPRGLDLDRVESWLKDAIARRHASADVEGEFPRYAWARVGGQTYEARLSNSGLGQYKGYPIESYEAPGWLP